MKRQFLIANWKSHKTLEETQEWFDEFAIYETELASSEEKKVVVCPPFPLLPLAHELVHNHHMAVALGAQDISPFPEGAYTGAVAGKLLRELVLYTIIGHSERRQYFHESLDELSQKVLQALSVGITPVYCVSQKEEKIPKGVTIVAYEPLSAIGSGKPDEPEEVEEVARFIKQKNDVLYVLYGGSVTAENVVQYASLASINGVLIGGASLSASDFAKIIQHA